MKKKTKKRIMGSITILLVIIMVPMMTMSAIIVDSSRINMARSMISSAGDLTMNTALANYDTILKDVYGLFAMSQNKTDDELANDLRNYFSKTLVSYGVTSEEESGEYVDALIGDFKQLIADTESGSVGNFLDMNVYDFTATKVENSSLANADVMRSQIVEYMKYRAPLEFGLSFLDSIKSFKNVQSQTNVVQSQVEAQESVQDVSRACNESIKAIREYDDLVKSIQEGDKAVKGVNNKSDKQIVKIENYDTQVDKYHSTWADNYKHASKINLAFLLKSPSVSSLYLTGLNISQSQWYIKSNFSGIIYSNTGINLNPSCESSTSAAKNQVQNQINYLNNSANVEKQIASNYTNLLKGDYISSDLKSFKNETAAANAFVEFEKFLLDQGTLKYSNAKKALEGIYKLSKYYDNYNGKITAEIKTAKNEMDTAAEAVNTAASNADTRRNYIINNTSAINNSNKNYTAEYEFLDGVFNGNNENLKDVFAAMLAQQISHPSSTVNVGGKNFTNYNGYVNKFKESSSDSDNRYMKVFKEIINSSLGSNPIYKGICDKAKAFLDSSSTDFASYANSYKNNELYSVLTYLQKNSIRVGKIEKYVKEYNQYKNGYQAKVDIYDNKKTVYDRKVSEKNTIQTKYQNCLSSYNSFTKNYQTDISYYTKYVTTATNVVTSNVAAVNAQFVAIKNNIDSIIKKLEDISSKLDTTKKAIETYQGKIDSWEIKNNAYVSNNSSDSFSNQNTADIESSRSQYDLKSLETLKDYVEAIRKEYQDFYDILTNDVNFKYGSKKIDTISDASGAKSAVPENIRNALPSIVSLTDADGKFSQLYKSSTTDGIEMDNWYFLDPVLPIQFLRFLNSTYQEASEQTNSEEIDLGDGEKATNEAIKSDYEATKTNIKNDNNGSEISDDTEADKYGYTYKNVDNMPDDVPSKDEVTKKANKSTFKISEDDEGDIKASDSISEQSSALGSILDGIADVATGALENTYIMSYLFNNFSYNTLIQEMVIDNEKAADGKKAEDLFEAKELLTAENIKNYSAKAMTLSNVEKNAKNNYFYGAEVEYVLYGNKNAATNVTYTKASIYAVRFAFNCIFAFTNSEIKNTTMGVGLAVQAATLGVVPYKIVQVIMQLALAAAESAIDLDMMNNGLKVAVVKTNDTWFLSLSSAVKKAGQVASTIVASATKKAVGDISAGLQSLVDAGVDEVTGSVNELAGSLKVATENKVEQLVGDAFMVVQSAIETELNKLTLMPYDGTTVKSEVDKAFTNLSSTIESELQSTLSGNPLGEIVLPLVTAEIDSVLADVKSNIIAKLNAFPDKEPSSVIVEQMDQIKHDLIVTISNKISSVVKIDSLVNQVNTLTASVGDELKDTIKGYGDNLSEQASQQIKDKASQTTNDFINTYLSDGFGSDALSSTSGGVGAGVGGKTSSSVASMIKFGYKDYLMLFVFVSLAVDDNPVLCRIADLIEINVQKAGKGASFSHKKGGDFKMKNACTYIAINASVDLNMLFMNLDFFARQVTDEAPANAGENQTDTEVTGDFTAKATIEYNGVYGY